MALHETNVGHRTQDLLRVLLIIVAAVVVMLIATAIFGMEGTGPSLEIIPDPAGALPF